MRARGLWRALSLGLMALGMAPAWLSASAWAASSGCAAMEHGGQGYTVCRIPLGADLRIFQQDGEGAVLGSFSRVNALLAHEGKELAFAMNAGMYHDDRSPVGLLVERGEARAPIVTSEGPGNFGMLPNGVFCIQESGFAVIESRAFAASPPACRYASQSGPMLVIDGALHPRFIPDSDSRYIRNGVGVSADGKNAWFAISDRPVNFAEFGALFRDGLSTPSALYFDGKISRLYAPDIGRNDFGFRMGPMVGLAVPSE